MSSDVGTAYGLALAFDSDDPEFARGVEVGRLWEQLKDPEPLEQTIHAGNVEMAVRMAEATGRRMVVEDSPDPCWVHLRVEGA